MHFAAPIYLLGLIPFAAFALWLCFGRRKRTRVPFLPLWDAPEELRRPKKGFEPPPLAIVLALLALLWGLLAMARPEIWRRGGRIAIVVDRGASMSATVESRPRFVEAAGALSQALFWRRDVGTVEWIDAVTGEIFESDKLGWFAQVIERNQTAVNSDEPIQSAIRAFRARGLPVMVISDRPIAVKDEQVIRVTPEVPVKNAGIVAIAVNGGQVMVSYQGNLDAFRTLPPSQSASDGPIAVRTIELSSLPHRHGSSDGRVAIQIVEVEEKVKHAFFDLPNPPDVIQARLLEGDSFAGDDTAWVVRRASWPVIEARIALPEEVGRVLAAYARHRPAGPSSNIVRISREADAGVVLAQVGGEATLAKVDVAAHPVSESVDWTALASAALAEKGPGEGWATIVSVGGRPLVAVREGERRQAWVGFSSREFALSAGFVELWTSVLDWVGRGGEEFAYERIAHPMTGARRIAPKMQASWEADYWPGVFETGEATVAVNASVMMPRLERRDWRSEVAAMRAFGRDGVELAPFLGLAAVAFLAGAALTWRVRESRHKITDTHEMRVSGGGIS